MTVKIKPSSANGRVEAPPSKSLAHRMLICASLSDGESVIENIGESDDVKATVRCLKDMGATIRIENGNALVRGIKIGELNNKETLNCGDSGSTLRFLIPVLLASGREFRHETGDSLSTRPLDVYENICREKGLTFIREGKSLTVKGPLECGEFSVPGNISSQFTSGLLMTLPLLSGDSTVRVTPPFESAFYTDMTVNVLSRFGAEIERNENDFTVKGNIKYNPVFLRVKGDSSSAAYLEAFNTVGGRVKITNPDNEYPQPDSVYPFLFDKVKNGNKTVDISGCPDLGPILFAVAALNKGGRFTGVTRLRIKESDRIKAMADELAKVGVLLKADNGSVEVSSCRLHAPAEPFDGHNDHRIVMAAALICSVTGGEIRNAETVSKSFPDFFEKLTELGINTEILT